MKKIFSMLVVLFLMALIGATNQSTAMNAKGHPTKGKQTKIKPFANVNLRASNSTNDGVHVVLENNTSGGSNYFFIPAHTPNNTVIGQIPESSDSYTVKLTSTGGAHDMWVYWEHRSQVTGLSVSGMSIGCGSCAEITIFN